MRQTHIKHVRQGDAIATPGFGICEVLDTRTNPGGGIQLQVQPPTGAPCLLTYPRNAKLKRKKSTDH